MNRRTLLTGLGAFLAAPAIVRASSIMPVKAWNEFGWVSEIDGLTHLLVPNRLLRDVLNAARRRPHGYGVQIFPSTYLAHRDLTEVTLFGPETYAGFGKIVIRLDTAVG